MGQRADIPGGHKNLNQQLCPGSKGGFQSSRHQYAAEGGLFSGGLGSSRLSRAQARARARCLKNHRGRSQYIYDPYDGSHPKRILIVEDNKLDVRLLRDILETRGYETWQTGDGLEAINLAVANLPDLILMDIQLPVVSGLEVTRRLRDDDRF